MPPILSRRQFVRSSVAGSLIMPAILHELLASENNPRPHHAPRASRVIFLFMNGGVSHVDSFDPKPRLSIDHGRQVTLTHPETQNRPGYERLFLKRPQWTFRKRGQSGMEISDMFPRIAECADDLCLIRSMHTSHSNHYNAALGMHTGSFTVARPSAGAWVSYGLGSLNQNLPTFVAIAASTPYAGGQLWGADFLPGGHQGTFLSPSNEPMRNVRPQVPPVQQRRELDALAELNRAHLANRSGDPDLTARLRSFELAFGMQSAAPEAFDLARETNETLALYGLRRGQTSGYAWQCLIARRLAERGVRFIELIDSNWDAHGDMLGNHGPRANEVDRPIAGLLKDLKRRGLLDDTLVVWTTEFGRTPFNNTASAPGREHHPWAFSSWLAGGGVKRGFVHGTTDEHGIHADTDRVHVHDFQATILHLLGLDHTRLTYRHAGRDFRLTDVAGQVANNIIA